MARLARTVLAGIPYHITHRGNRRGEVFFGDADRRSFLAELGLAALRFGLQSWGWCLMDNHVHLLAVPGDEHALARVTR